METLSQIREIDKADALNHFRNQYLIPQAPDGSSCIYLTGNSLGLQPLGARKYILEELEDWAKWGVEGHVHSRRPWVNYHRFFSDSLAKIVGAKSEEVVAMNGLTTNLHLLMVSFYRPKGLRRKIICEAKAFPSDLYAFKSQIRFHGGQESDLIALKPRNGEHLLRTEDILQAIEEVGNELALCLLGGVNYYTGQWFDMPQITLAAKAHGAFVGWDLAHAAGNVPLELHKWQVDFAVWCSYKYLNSGPGGVSGVFIHEKHHGLNHIPRFEGWWGHNAENRFKMPDNFEPMPTAEAWQLSNAPILSMAAHRAALDLFDEAGMPALREKSLKLTAYLESILNSVQERFKTGWEIISPKNPNERGCQLSLLTGADGKNLFDYLTAKGVVADWREPNVIRMAAVPMYNSFEDLFNLQNHLLHYYEQA